MASKAWADLSPTYRARLERNGYTPAMHAAGVSKVAARGHGHDAQWSEFRKLDGHHIVKNFDKLPFKEKQEVARLWKSGFMTPGPHDEQRAEDRIMFQGWLDQNQSAMSKDDWATFKHDYQTIFGGG